MSSPTLGRPNFMPKSERLICALASAPHSSFLFMGWLAHLKEWMVSVTGLVTPSKSEIAFYADRRITFVFYCTDLYERLGNSATLKKSGERRWSSRLPKPVVIEAASMVTSTDPLFAARFKVSFPLLLSKRPCMVEKPRWLTLKCAKVCWGSML